MVKANHAMTMFSELAQMEKQWLTTAKVEKFAHFDGLTDELVMRVKYAEIPEDWAIRVGLIVNTARSALEYVAYELVRRDTPAMLSAKGKPLKTAWPIKDERPGSSNLARVFANELPGVRDAALERVYAEQPFNDDHDPASHDFSILRELSNSDKHRTIVTRNSIAIPFLMLNFGLERPVRCPLYPDRPPHNGEEYVHNASIGIGAGNLIPVGPPRPGKAADEMWRMPVRWMAFDARGEASPPFVDIPESPVPTVTYGDPRHPTDLNRLGGMVSSVLRVVETFTKEWDDH